MKPTYAWDQFWNSYHNVAKQDQASMLVKQQLADCLFGLWNMSRSKSIQVHGSQSKHMEVNPSQPKYVVDDQTKKWKENKPLSPHTAQAVVMRSASLQFVRCVATVACLLVTLHLVVISTRIQSQLHSHFDWMHFRAVCLARGWRISWYCCWNFKREQLILGPGLWAIDPGASSCSWGHILFSAKYMTVTATWAWQVFGMRKVFSTLCSWKVITLVFVSLSHSPHTFIANLVWGLKHWFCFRFVGLLVAARSHGLIDSDCDITFWHVC